MPWRVKDSEILLSLQGGLGNQLFQWAYARALQDSGRTVLFDSVRCRGDRPLMIGDLIPSNQRFNRVCGLTLASAFKAGLINDRTSLRLVKQLKSGFDPSVTERLTRRSYLMGYFQSEKYFEDSADLVRGSINSLVQTMLTPAGDEARKRLSADDKSVAIHVRRGDYVSDPNAASRHGTLTQHYYDLSLRRLDELGITNRTWFGDDPQWIKENLAHPDDTICSPEWTKADGGEIAIMAAASSRVIANSSFSWWAGWLGKPSTSVNPVISPLAWFSDGHSDANELIPANWVRL